MQDYKLDIGSLLGFLLIIILVACVSLALHDDRQLSSPEWKVGDPIEDEEKPPTEVVEKRRTKVVEKRPTGAGAVGNPQTGLVPSRLSLQPGLQVQDSQKNTHEKLNGTLDRSDPLKFERSDPFGAVIEKPGWNEPLYSTPRVKPEKE